MRRVLAKGMHGITLQLILKDGLLLVVGHLQGGKGGLSTGHFIAAHPQIEHITAAEVTAITDEFVAEQLQLSLP